MALVRKHLMALYDDGWQCACGFVTQSDAHAREHIARAELAPGRFVVGRTQ